MDLGPNAVFVWSAYGVFAAVIAAALLWLIGEGARLQRRLDRLDAEGVRRRSARSTAAPPKGPD
jgi:heme exporter protein D